jgi:hypothetical protein
MVKDFDPTKAEPPLVWGTYEDAAALSRWSFLRRTPEQRLAWLVSVLELAYQSGALKPRRPDGPPSADQDSRLPAKPAA